MVGSLAGGTAAMADPTLGDCVSAAEASLKSRNEQRLRAARSQALICSAPSCPDDVRSECAKRIEALNPSIPTVIFEAQDPQGLHLTAVRVIVDGEVLAEHLEGTALSIDPGKHTFVFEAEGRPNVTEELVLYEAQKNRHEVVTFGGGEPVRASATSAAPPAAHGGGLGTQKTAALAVAGVGVAGLVVGTITGILAITKKSTAEDLCPNLNCPTHEGTDAWSSAATLGTLSTVGFIVGGVGVAGAAALWLTAPKSSSTQVGLTPGGLQLRGVW